MADLVQSNMALLVVALLVVAVMVLWLVMANRRTRIELAPHDDGSPARRNQALIDAPLATMPHAEVGVVPLLEPDATVVAMPDPTPSPIPSGTDDLLLIKGLGPKLKMQLAELGITSFAQIAAWGEADIDRIDAQLGRFQGRIRRESWVEQARLLAAGDTAGFAAKFGNNG
jgi:predicted flap endonuclease-1-like 5' DNA nuclease